jgi:hypothetical protein
MGRSTAGDLFTIGANDEGRWLKLNRDGSSAVKVRPLTPTRELEIREECSYYEREGGAQIEKLDTRRQMELMAEEIVVDWRGIVFPGKGEVPCTKENKMLALLNSTAFLNRVTDFARKLADMGEEFVDAQTENLGGGQTSDGRTHPESV